jgi:hypothetical protein
VITLDEAHAMNRLAITHLRDPKRLRFCPAPIAAPSKHADPYEGAGSHPDIVERLWDRLGRALPIDGRALVYGAPALVHPAAGVILALAYGTQYALRVPEALVATAIERGCKTQHTWSSGMRTVIADVLGPGWVFGAWLDEELAWLASAYKGLEAAG